MHNFILKRSDKIIYNYLNIFSAILLTILKIQVKFYLSSLSFIK